MAAAAGRAGWARGRRAARGLGRGGERGGGGGGGGEEDVTVSFDWVEADSAEDGGRIRPVYALRFRDEQEAQVVRVPELEAAGPFADCSVSRKHLALLPARRGAWVMCSGENKDGQLGDGDRAARRGLCQAAPLRAAAVCAGSCWTAALRRDGTLFTWGKKEQIGRGGIPDFPASVRGLAALSLLAVGEGVTIAVTTQDDVYWWGRFLANRVVALYVCSDRPMRIAALSGRGIRRVACGETMIAAETRRGELLVLRSGFWLDDDGNPPKRLGSDGMRFPLRSLVCSLDMVFAADAAGAVWITSEDDEAITIFGTPLQPWRAVRLAAWWNGVVVLTDEGELWTSSLHGPLWRSIRATNHEGPLGLVPYGGADAKEVVLAPEYCCGKWRLALFARIAMRIDFPSDPVREVLVPLMVHEAYLTGHSTDPFGCPVMHH